MEKPFQNSGVTRRLWRFQHTTVLEWSIEVGLSLIFSIYKVVYISIKDLHARYAAMRWRNLLSNLPKCEFGLVEIVRVMMFTCSAVYNSVSKQGRRSFFFHCTLLHVAYILPQKFARRHVPWLCSKVMSKSAHGTVYPTVLYILRPPTPTEAKLA